MEEEMVTVREAAAEYRRNPETIRRWVWAGKLPAKKLGNQLFISKKDLLNLREGEKIKLERSASFLEHARALQEKIRVRTKTDFDVSLLIEKSRMRGLAGEDLH
jgi:hypothetical protein